MAMKKRNKESGGEGGWIVTYADLMTLLLCFFVLLYAMSQSIDEEKYQTLANSLQNAFLGSVGEDILDGMSSGGDSYSDDGEDLSEDEVAEEGGSTTEGGVIGGLAEELHDVVEAFISIQGLDSGVNVTIVPEGIMLDIQEQILFDLGKAEIKTQSLDTLSKIGSLFKKFDNDIRVIGHTDSIPINTSKFASNWELAAARSCAIVRYYNSQGFDPDRFVCMSYGDTAPIDTNETEEGRMANRRVNFLIEATPNEIKKLSVESNIEE